MVTSDLMVVIGDRRWTNQAVHLACAIARGNGGTVVLASMVPVHHPAQLGDASGRVRFTDEDRHALFDFAATAEDYGVDCRQQICTYANYSSGIASAAEQLNIGYVFAPPFRSRWPWLARWKMWRLRRLVQRPLFALQTPEDQPILSIGRPAVGSEPGAAADGGLPAMAHPL